ncbi:bifunctional diaminohydroxyphosphoribosylaminopyrimidine deaminase/5-amino-6-(5-phosphoribosylamino)uracil reductase RibD [Lentiprolixibacter aurantiacus]|uniref:Riboflavin biosynthesis protein RibD n=1 Tax=Lentiprolixibacter aurantiacus TaxID=2993939 RepID=A0AAE3SN50_9FLAO|nr:bifunctional diaminohydroxyphosphoribosylaminopyrimidine deaminase/5-amino-6-(5-phosphoribosylamino)uracil reductase RibD [Lentiprolixibacter aurantiacus]
MKIHEKYMARCIEIAKNAMGSALPNPMVGAVIVHKDSIIGEGFTNAFGGPHAEVNAINSVRDKALLAESTLYVTLEPCSHHGKTPPCTDLIIKHGIPTVVIGTKDPHEKVAGVGFKLLKKSGCKVVMGILEEDCRLHHCRFLTYHEKKRPYVILKWAESADGYLAPAQDLRDSDPQPYWISSNASRQLVHKWRSEEQAVLVGTNTALKDNPSLTTRNWKGKNPLRVLLDRKLRVPEHYRILKGDTLTLILTQMDSPWDNHPGNQYIKIPKNEFHAKGILEVLWKQGIASVIVEGGRKVLDLFLDENLWDEARIFRGPVTFGNGLKAPDMDANNEQIHEIGPDQLKIIYND